MRRRAREVALQVLYLLEANHGLEVEGGLALFFAHFEEPSEGDELPAGPRPGHTVELRAFAERLVRGVVEHLEAIDALITRASANWRLERMARVDRNLLRLAAFELRYCDDIPPKVTINEAVEIAKRFGTKDSAAFINGVLDKVLTLGSV